MANGFPASPFENALRSYTELQAAFRSGHLSRADFAAQIEKLTVQDGSGELWWLDETGRWRWFDGEHWMLRTPPPDGSALEAPSRPSKPGKNNLTWLKIGLPMIFGLLCLCLLVVITTGVLNRLNVLNLRHSPTEAITGPLEEAAQTPGRLEDETAATPPAFNPVSLSGEQQQVVEDLEWPDTFMIIEVDHREGRRIRQETWAYHQGKTTLTFLDGVFMAEGEVDRLPPGYVPTPYHPDQFPLGSSLAQVQAALAGITLLSVEDAEPPQGGVRLYAGPQLMLGFLNDRLFYVDALAFIPEGSE